MRLAVSLLFAIAVSCGPGASSNNSQSEESASTPPTSETKASSEPFTDLSVEEFIKLASEDDNGVILDVRTPSETAEGMVPGAIEIDFRADDFSAEVGKLDKSKNYYVYCRSGGRSVGACEEMAKQGFPKLYNMLGGYNAYKERL